MSLRRNILANYAGQAWTGVMGIAFIPICIRILGIEAYGLVGIFAILQGAMALLDTGLTPTFNREMARYSAGARSLESTLDLLRSLEFVYFGFGVLLVGIVWLAAPWLAAHWLKAGHIPQAAVAHSLTMMAAVVALKTCEVAYRGAIQGMQRQVWLNGVQAVMATLRWAGVVGVLMIVPSIDAYFLWQGLVSLLTVLVYARQTYYWLPSSPHRNQFSLENLRSVSRFAAGLAATTLASLVLTQTDKVLLAKYFTLPVMGYYTVAATVAAMLSVFVYPITYALYPRLTELVARNDTAGEADTYITVSQWLSVISVPPAVTLAAFAKTSILAWSGDPVLAEHAAPIVRLIVLGNLCNGFMNPPYMLQLASGWPSLSLKANIAAIFFVVPTLLLVVPRYGAVGAAAVWLSMNAAYVLFVIHVMHRRLLPEWKWVWYRTAIVLPLAGGGGIALLLAWLLPSVSGRLSEISLLLAVGLVVGLTVLLLVPRPRASFRTYLRLFRVRAERLGSA